MKCSFIVSTFERPDVLAACLLSLKLQTFHDFEVLITDNSKSVQNLEKNRAVLGFLCDPRFRYIKTECPHCYSSANVGVGYVTGQYLSFPSDDDYFVPGFLATMLTAEPAELIYCDMVHDPRDLDRIAKDTMYRVVNVEPKCGRIDKAGFLIKREKFKPFPWQARNGTRAADGMLVDDLVRSGVTVSKVPGVLWVHN